MKTLPHMRRVRAQRKLPIFWKWPPKNIPEQQKCAAFQNLQKSAKSLHPTPEPILQLPKRKEQSYVLARFLISESIDSPIGEQRYCISILATRYTSAMAQTKTWVPTSGNNLLFINLLISSGRGCNPTGDFLAILHTFCTTGQREFSYFAK